MAKGASAYRGIPRDQWSTVKAEREAAAAREAAKEPDEFARAAAAVIAASAQPEVPAAIRQMASEAPKLNSDSATPQALPPDLFSGTIKTLEVYGLNGSTTDPIPGYYLYWFNDVSGNGERIAQARRAGYEFVRVEEVALTDSFNGSNVDPGGLVCKVVNPTAVPPTKAYLMKQPLELHERNMRERDLQHQRVEQALAMGRVSSATPQDRQYAKSDDPRSDLPAINISSHIVR